MFSVLFLLKEIFLVTCAGSEKDVIFFFYRAPFWNSCSRCAFSPRLSSSLGFLLGSPSRMSQRGFGLGGVRPPMLQRKKPGLIGLWWATQAFVFSITAMEEQGDINDAVITHLHGQTRSTGELSCKDAVIFRVSLPWMICICEVLFLCENLRNTIRNLHASYTKLIQMC